MSNSDTVLHRDTNCLTSNIINHAHIYMFIQSRASFGSDLESRHMYLYMGIVQMISGV